MSGEEGMDLKEYKNIETRLYGELMKTCRRYTNDLNLISVLGILDIVSQEIKDLEKTGRSFMKPSGSSAGEEMPDEKAGLESIM